jgi:hypothetical protein
VVIAKNGSIKTEGEVIAKGGIKTNTISAIDSGSNVTVALNNSSTQFPIANQAQNSKLQIVNGENKEVASIDASGSAYFSQGVAFDKNMSSSSAVLNKDTTWSKYAINAPGIETNNEVSGEATLPIGETELVIINNKVKSNSLIYVSPLSSTSNQILYVESKGEGKYFKVKIDQPITNELKFNWWIL